MPHPSARSLVIGYAAFLTTLLLGVLLFPGVLLQRDMVVLQHPALTLSALGFGSLPARNVPQDSLLALFGLLDASWLVRLLLIGCAIGGVLGLRKLTDNPWAQAAGITITLWNPFVVERLLQGHWALVIAAWLIPALIASKGDIRVYWLFSLTPTGAVLGLIIAVLSSAKKVRTVIFGLLCWLPWLVPSLIAPPTSTATAVFLGRAEGYVGTIGAFLGLGGIWNAAAVPWSRHVGFAVFGVVLFFLLSYLAPRKWLILAACATAVFGLLLIDAATQLFTLVPGAALVRDSQKLALLLIPALVLAATKITSRTMAIVVITLALFQVPDAPVALKAIQPIAQSPAWHHHPGRVLNLDSEGLISYQGRVMVDPLTKATEVVESGQLVVDGEITDQASPHYNQAVNYWRNRDTQSLIGMGIGTVIEHGQQVVLTDKPQLPPELRLQYVVGLLLFFGWLGLPMVYSLLARRRPVSSQE